MKLLHTLKTGDIVTRKSYGGDVYFRIVDIHHNEKGEPVYHIKGLSLRLHADAEAADLLKQETADAMRKVRQEISVAQRYAFSRKNYFRLSILEMLRTRPGRVLHLDADGEFLNTCLKHYRSANVPATGKELSEDQQPNHVRRLLEQYKPDILVVTGHDGIKKGSASLYSMDNYRSSKYFVQSVKEARSYEPSLDKLCIFAGACQSYYEAIIQAGANFASSPGRVLINALDPSIVAEKVSLTDSRSFVTPVEIAEITVSGSDGIGGVKTRGHFLKS